ncbi:hypothetical protein CR513_07184, partial [Mucuna pruriens]
MIQYLDITRDFGIMDVDNDFFMAKFDIKEDEENVMNGSLFDHYLAVDSNTLRVEHGRLAQVCIEIDLTQPIYKVEYKNLHIIFISYECYGHLALNCSITEKESFVTIQDHLKLIFDNEDAIEKHSRLKNRKSGVGQLMYPMKFASFSMKSYKALRLDEF